MGRETFTRDAYSRVAGEATSKGSATHAGEQRHKEGKGLHELVDPKGFGVIRRALTWYEPEGEIFKLLRGVAMLEETRLDTTGSMGGNVAVAMKVLPKTYDLLAKIPNAVLCRYDVQMITSIFGDVQDNYVLCRSQAEMDVRIAEQMTLMFPEGDGGDSDEDPQYGLFGAAYLTQADINQYGLKYYDFTITDARGRDRLSAETLIRVFGETVFEKVKENGFQIKEKSLPTTKEVVCDLLKNAHAFILLVGENGDVVDFWTNIYGAERVVVIPSVQLLPEIKSTIIGLTEGNLTLQDVENFLVNDAGLTHNEAKSIKRAVAGIPIGAQAMLPGFNKLPLKGELFAKKRDLWPMEIGNEENADATEKTKEKTWL